MYFFVSVRNINKDVSAKRNSIEYDRKASATLTAVRQAFDDTELERSKIDGYIMPVGGELKLITLIEAIAEEVGVIVEVGGEKTVVETETVEGTVSRNFNVKSAGSWQDMYRLLVKLETVPYKSSITNLSLTKEIFTPKDPKLQPAIVWRLSVNLSILRYKT